MSLSLILLLMKSLWKMIPSHSLILEWSRLWKGLLRRTRGSLAVFGALAAIIIYGGIMNPAAALMYLHEINWKILLTYYMTGVPVDLVHAAATAFFLWVAAEPMLEKLDRIKTKYGLVE